MVDNFIYLHNTCWFLFSPEIKCFCMWLNQGKKEVFCHMCCFSPKKKEVGRCITGRNSPAISVPQIHTVCRTSVSTLGFILDFPGIWVLCVSFRSQRQSVPPSTPSLNSSRSLIQRHLPLDSLFTSASPAPSLTIPYPALFFSRALNTQCIEQCSALAGTQENIYWIGKFIENLESPEFCISTHLILGVTKWLTLTNELCKWKWQYITLG